ncbi:MAG: type effector HopL1 [Labilithrix sp.]|nr:type effector HopL1 [Labilithrix sp.]
MSDPVSTLEQAITETQSAIVGQPEAENEALVLRDLALRARKLRRAWARKQSVGLFGPSQAGKSFLVGALLSHELGSLRVQSRNGEVDFLREINPAKGVESTGVVTRFSASPTPPLRKGDFYCEVLSLDGVLQSMATGFLVECTSPPLDVDRVERTLREAKLQAGPPAAPVYARAWESVWHELTKKYQDRHPYLNELRRHPSMKAGIAKEVGTAAGWVLVYSLLWGGPGYAKDLDQLMRTLVSATEQLGYAEAVEVGLAHVRASSDAPSVIDASCLNALGTSRTVVPATTLDGRDVALDPGVLAALIAEIRLSLRGVTGSLLDKADLLDFPGGRALKGINGFGPAELNTGRLENAIEVYKRGKLTFLFEQYSVDREITALLLCSPGPTKPEAIQLQSQVESWLSIRHGSSTPKDAKELEQPSLFLALTKFDMSLGALRSDNAKDRWDSRVEEACVDFWARGHGSWILNWGAKGRPFTNLFWVRNPYADQMLALKPGEADYEAVKQGYLASRAVATHIASPEEKWLAVEGHDSESGLPKSGVPLLATHIRAKLHEDVKARELAHEARAIRSELLSVLKTLTPSRDETEARARRIEDARQLVTAMDSEMARRCTGAVFGEFVDLVVAPEQEIEAEVRKVIDVVMPMSIKASDKVKKVLVHVLKWWAKLAAERLRSSELAIPQAQAESFVREVCTSKLLLPVLGQAIFPYFARTQVDVPLVATILRVKICDAMLGLMSPQARRTPAAPVRLSYAEDGAESAAAVDWSNVDFDDEPTEDPGKGVSIVFAGNRYYSIWSQGLADFFVKSGGARSGLMEDSSRAQRLLEVLKRVEVAGDA